MKAVRDADLDRYLSALYAPEAKRGALFALYAFNAEISGIRDRTSEILAAEIRLQWWREVIDSGSERSADGHPVAEALLSAITEFGLPRAAFENYLEARMFDLFNDPMPSRGDLEGYCGETASTIMQLAALVLDSTAAPKHPDLAGHAGCAQAITGLLRLLPLHRARGQCFVPRDILAAAGTSPEEFIADHAEEAGVRAIDATIALAREHLGKFSAAAAVIPETLRPAFLPAALTPAYLDGLLRKRGKALTETTDIAGWKRHWTLFRKAARGW